MLFPTRPELSFHIEIGCSDASDTLLDLAESIEEEYRHSRYMPGVVNHLRELAKLIENVPPFATSQLHMPPAEAPAEFVNQAPWDGPSDSPAEDGDEHQTPHHSE